MNEQKSNEAAQYAYSTNEEIYSGPYGSIGEALGEASSKFELVGQRVYVGRTTKPTQPEDCFDAEDWLDQLSDRDEYCGEHADGWNEATQIQLAELDKEVRAVMSAWLDRHNLRPKFFIVTDIEEYEVTGFNEDGQPIFMKVEKEAKGAV